MRVGIHYEYRLGDIIRCLPIARYGAAKGHEVEILCLAQYHSFFDCVTYCRPATSGKYDRIFSPQIWPRRYQAFRDSGKSWMDFVYADFPDVDRTIVLDNIPLAEGYGLPDRYSLCCPFGYSQTGGHSLAAFVNLASRTCGPGAFHLLADEPQREYLVQEGWDAARIVTARSLAHLPALIAGAEHFLTINSAPTIIAAAVRQSYHHIPDANYQDDYFHPSQIRVAA